MSKYVRAQDIQMAIRRDGAPLIPIAANSGTFDRGLQMEEIPLVGQAVPDVDGFNGVKSLGLDLNPRSPEFHDLLDAQEGKNAGDDEFIDAVIDAEFTIDFGRQGRVRYLMPDCVVSEGAHSFGGGTDRVTATITLTSSTLKRLT